MQPNDLVHHKKFGTGRIVSVTERYTIVDFEGTEKKYVTKSCERYLKPVIDCAGSELDPEYVSIESDELAIMPDPITVLSATDTVPPGPQEEISVIAVPAGRIRLKKIICAVLGILAAVIVVGAAGLGSQSWKASHEGIETQAGIYTGELSWGSFEGIGTMAFYDGGTYTGDWYDNLMHGAGTMTYADGSAYSGNYTAGIRTGDGTYCWDNGDVYSGAWDADQPNGEGKLKLASGAIYRGTFTDGQLTEGEYIQPAEEYTTTLYVAPGEANHFAVSFLDGTQIDGIASGNSVDCTINFASGDTYAGTIIDGARNGQGTYSWASGESYTGSWENDAMTGTGKFIFADGDVLDGTFFNNAFMEGTATAINNGTTFTYRYANGAITDSVTVKLSDGTTYTGTYSGSKLTGTGTIKYHGGDSYTGRVIDGLKSGSGKYIWNDGDWYEGSWSNDMMNGSGVYYFTSGTTQRLTGSFSNNKPTGTCYYYHSDGTRYVTTWSNGSKTNMYKG